MVLSWLPPELSSLASPPPTPSTEMSSAKKRIIFGPSKVLAIGDRGGAEFGAAVLNYRIPWRGISRHTHLNPQELHCMSRLLSMLSKCPRALYSGMERCCLTQQTEKTRPCQLTRNTLPFTFLM